MFINQDKLKMYSMFTCKMLQHLILFCTRIELFSRIMYHHVHGSNAPVTFSMESLLPPMCIVMF